MGGSYGIGHAASLAAHLPYGSRVIALIMAKSQSEGRGATQGEVRPMDELDEILAKPRKEVQYGG